MTILLSLMIFVNVLILVMIAIFARRLSNIHGQIIDIFLPDGEKASPAAQFIENASDILARAVVARAKMTFMSSQASQAKGEKVIEADLAEDMLSAQNPMISSIMNSFPALRKTLRRNPGLADLAVQKLIEKVGSGSGSAKTDIGSNGSDRQSAFNL